MLAGQLGVGLPVSYDPATHCLYVTSPDETPRLAVWPPGGDVGLALRDLDICLTLADQFRLFYEIRAVERSDT